MKPLPQPPTDRRLDELFVRYWDNTLTDAQAEDLEQRLKSDPAARAWFQFLLLQVSAAADFGAVARAVSESVPSPRGDASGRRPWLSRRGLLGFLSGSLAAGLVLGGFNRWFRAETPGTLVRATAVRGTVTVRTADGREVPNGAPIPPGGIVSTYGLDSSVVLAYPDGTGLSLIGDSIVTLADGGLRLLLRQGAVTADVRPQPPDASRLTLATGRVSLPGLSGVLMTLGQTASATDVEVHQGVVDAAAPSGERLDIVRAGELLTVRSGGDHQKRPTPTTPEEFAWDLSRPLPEDWHIGCREVTADGPVVRPEFWFDPYHQAIMSQVRSNNQWTRGFFRLEPSSLIRVRYWVDEPGPSQLCFCVRTDQPRSPETGMVECNTAFAKARPREWQWLEVRAADMLDNRHAPKFRPPWVGFLIIFNTYKVDLGLRIAEFQVTRTR